jgi:hypothetical protein
MRKRLILLSLICVVASACGGSSKTESSSSATSTTTTARPCGPSEEGCTSAQVIATVEQLYVTAGATPVEASCLAPITGTGKSAVNQAFDVPKPGEEAAAMRCVGSQARLRTIVTSLADYFKRHPLG